MDRKVCDSTFVTGLNAPKGLAKFGNKLYAADISNVVVIDLNKGKVCNVCKAESCLNSYLSL